MSALSLSAATIHHRDGTVIEGRILSETPEDLRIETKYGNLHYDKEDLSRIDRDPPATPTPAPPVDYTLIIPAGPVDPFNPPKLPFLVLNPRPGGDGQPVAPLPTPAAPRGSAGPAPTPAGSPAPGAPPGGPASSRPAGAPPAPGVAPQAAAVSRLPLGVQHFSSTSFEQAVQSPHPVVIDFTATWCGPCKKYGPVFEAVAHELGGRAVFGKIDIDQHKAIAQRFQVQGVPCTIVLHNGKVVAKRSGAMDSKSLKTFLSRLM